MAKCLSSTKTFFSGVICLEPYDLLRRDVWELGKTKSYSRSSLTGELNYRTKSEEQAYLPPYHDRLTERNSFLTV